MEPRRNAPLSPRELTALVQIRLRSKIDPRDRLSINRLLHLGLVDEKPTGLFLTREGMEAFGTEASRRGLTAEA